MTWLGRSDLSPLERAAGIFTPSQREIEINRERAERKRVCAQSKSLEGVGGGCWRLDVAGWRRVGCKLAGVEN